MKRFLLPLIAILALLVLAGCSCRHEWSEASCTQAAVCRLCGQRNGSALGHDWQSATCEAPKTCAVCGATDGNPVEHQWLGATCSAPTTCALCGLTKDVMLEHNWTEATCEVPKNCSLCGLTDGKANGHSWKDATCTTAKTCNICATTEGKPLGHSWRKATCVTPQTCMTCGKEGNEPAGHSWLDANCIEPIRCEYCDVINGEPLGHDWLDATPDSPKTCTRCNSTEGFPIEEDPRFVVELCQPLFGSWQGTVTYSADELNIPGFDGQHIEHVTYIFKDYGVAQRITQVADEESYIAMLTAEMVWRIYSAQADEGRDAAAADAHWMDTHGVTIAEYAAELVRDDLTEDALYFTDELVYYVQDGVLYLASSWQDDAGTWSFAIDGDSLTLIDDFTEEALICTKLPSPESRV